MQPPVLPRVMILGAGRAMVRPVREVRSAGFEVVVVDDIPMPFAFESADRGYRASPTDPAQLSRVIDAVGHLDGAIATNEQGVVALSRLAQGKRLLAQDAETAAIVASKRRQREVIRDRAPAWAVPFAPAGTAADVCAFAATHGWPVILKPDCSIGGSRGVSIAAGPTDVDRALRFAVESAGESLVLVEPMLSGPQFSCEVLCSGGRCEVMAVGLKRKSPPPYCVDLAVIYPSGLAATDLALVARMVREIVEVMGLRETALHIEFAMTPLGPRPIEVNARVGGGFTPSLVEASTGLNPLVEYCRIACGMTPRWPDAGAQTGRGAVYGFTCYPPGKATGYTLPDNVLQDPHVIDASMFLPLDNVIRPLRWTSQRVGQIGIRDTDAAAATVRLDELARQMTVRYEDGSERGPLQL